MFFFRHPKSVVDPRAVAMQVVKQNVQGAVDKHILIIESTSPVGPNRLSDLHPDEKKQKKEK